MLELESGIDLDMKIGSLDEFCMLSIPIEKWHAGSSLNFGSTLIIQLILATKITSKFQYQQHYWYQQFQT